MTVSRGTLHAVLVDAFQTLGPVEVMEVMAEAMHKAAEESAPALAAQWAQRARDNKAENDEARR